MVLQSHRRSLISRQPQKPITVVGYALVVPYDGQRNGGQMALTSAPRISRFWNTLADLQNEARGTACARRFGDVTYDIRRVTITTA
jgi:hypothetical protein